LFTASASPETCALEDVDVPEPLGELEPLDEHAASTVAAPIAVTMQAVRAGRRLRLPILKRSMRPRTIDSGIDWTTLPTESLWVNEIVNGPVNISAYRFGLYRLTSMQQGWKLLPRHN
jgi:hypothetical protein